jgi:hypothetical protein
VGDLALEARIAERPAPLVAARSSPMKPSSSGALKSGEIHSDPNSHRYLLNSQTDPLSGRAITQNMNDVIAPDKPPIGPSMGATSRNIPGTMGSLRENSSIDVGKP